MHNNEADASARQLSSVPDPEDVPAIKGRCMQIKVSLSSTRVFGGDSLRGPAVYLLLWWHKRDLISETVNSKEVLYAMGLFGLI